MGFDPQECEEAEENQAKAAQDSSSLIRLIAGPGTGKSKVIEQRVSHLLNQGAKPKNIFVISYTRASANDLKRRIYKYCKNCNSIMNIDDINVSTLHSLALKILKSSGKLSKFPVDPLVLDEWEIENIFDLEFSISKNCNKKRAAEMRKHHESIWATNSELVPEENIISKEEIEDFDRFYKSRTNLYAAILPGEIIRSCVKEIEKDSSRNILSFTNITYLIIDEFQDLNPMDLKFVELIIQSGIKIFVAGDDDQSIYSFRHASPIGIQDFDKKYPSSKTYFLSHCFRCPPFILELAIDLIERYGGEKRIKKEYISMCKNSNPKIDGVTKYWKFRGYTKEAEAIAKSCKKLKEAGLSYNSIFILLKNRPVQFPKIKGFLDILGIRCELLKEENFRDTKIGRTLLAWIRLIGLPYERQDDYIALRSILKIKNGVGPQTINHIVNKIISSPLNFRKVFEDSSLEIFNKKAKKVIQEIRQELKRIADWQNTDTIKVRKDNIIKLINPIDSEDKKSLCEFLKDIPEQATLQELKDYIRTDNFKNREIVIKSIYKRLEIPVEKMEEREAVKIMSLHGCKGLSSDIVFIPGLENGVLPDERQKVNDKLQREGARMLFVGITRAKVCCILSYSTKRCIHGQTKTQSLSQYLSHLKEDFISGTTLTGDECKKISTEVKNMSNISS